MEDENRQDKSLVEDQFHVELVVESRKMEGPGLNATRLRVVRTEVCQIPLRASWSHSKNENVGA
jgi:hypothetical protein